MGQSPALQDSEQTEQVELVGGFEDLAVGEEGIDGAAGQQAERTRAGCVSEAVPSEDNARNITR